MKSFKFVIILIFIFALFIRIGLLCQKDDLFYDEVLNMTAANHNELYYNKADYFDSGRGQDSYSGFEVKQKFLIDNPSVKDAFLDIKNMHKFSGDVFHTNLYYSMARIMLIGMDKFVLSDYLLRLGFLNIILFSFAFFIMYRLLSLLFEDKKYVAIGLFLAFLNPASVSNTIFLREYQLQEMFVILMTYMSIFYYKNPIKIKSIPIISIVLALTLLSGYYVSFFVFCFFLIILHKREFKKLVFCSILTVIFLLMLYPKYFGFFFSKEVYSHVTKIERIKDVVSTMIASTTSANAAFASTTTAAGVAESSNAMALSKAIQTTADAGMAENATNSNKAAPTTTAAGVPNASSPTTPQNSLSAIFFNFFKYPLAIYHFICSYLLLFYFIFNGFKYRKVSFKNKKIIIVLTLIALFWVVVVLSTTPFKVVRYVLPAIPICTIILTMILYACNSKKSIIFVVSFLILHLTMVTLNTFVGIKNGMTFSSIKLKSSQSLIFEEKEKLPVYIISKNYETLATIVTHIEDSRKIIFVDNKAEIKDSNYYLCTDGSFKIDLTVIKQQKTNLYYSCYELLEQR